MDVIHTRCCGLDVHKRTVVACVITPGPKRQPHKERRTFGTMTEDLMQLADWLEACLRDGRQTWHIFEPAI